MSSENIKFYIHTTNMLADISAAEIHRVLTLAHGNDIISLRRVQSLMKEYRDGGRDGYEDGRFNSGKRKSDERMTVIIDTVREMIT